MRLQHRNLARFLAFIAAAFLLGTPALAADWLTAPSYYTHSPESGQRVAQYAPVGPFYYFTRPDYLKSGYRQLRSTLDLGNSSDNMHLVEEWGAQVIPYEAWRFPFRPYSAPYPAWGPPFGGLGGGTGGYPYSGGAGANLFGFFPPFFGGVGVGGFGVPAPAAAAASGMGGPPAAAGMAAPGMAPGYGPGGGPGYGGYGGHGGHGGYPAFPPAVNFAQPWLDGHYPAYDLNDRSPYWQPYVAPGRP